MKKASRQFWARRLHGFHAAAVGVAQETPEPAEARCGLHGWLLLCPLRLRPLPQHRQRGPSRGRGRQSRRHGPGSPAHPSLTSSLFRRKTVPRPRRRKHGGARGFRCEVGGVSVFSAGLYLPGHREHCHGFGRKKMELKMEKAGWDFEGAGHASRMFCLRSRQSPWRSTRPCAGRKTKRVEQHSGGATGEPPALFQALLREYVGYRQRVSSLLFFLRDSACLSFLSAVSGFFGCRMRTRSS